MASPAEVAAMWRALELGASALGRTSPNPPVGAVVLDADGVPVGEGCTQPPGEAHAEVVALATAGERARGGAAVVTLEPCGHTGRTGPCVDALVAAGIARVVYAVPDPDPVAGGGAARLRAAGVQVEGGLLAAEAAREALEPWLHAVRHHRPYLAWKFASTLDGRVAAADGTSRWITGVEARADVHRLRAQVDAVVVGVGTVLADDPELTVRTPDGDLAERQPLRVVLDRSGRTPADARVRAGAAATLLLAEPDPSAALRALYARDIRYALLEGGPTVAGAFLRAGCIQRIVGYLAPALLGAGPPVLTDAGIGTIADALRLHLDDVRQLGDDIRITARLPGAPAGAGSPQWADRPEEG